MSTLPSLSVERICVLPQLLLLTLQQWFLSSWCRETGPGIHQGYRASSQPQASWDTAVWCFFTRPPLSTACISPCHTHTEELPRHLKTGMGGKWKPKVHVTVSEILLSQVHFSRIHFFFHINADTMHSNDRPSFYKWQWTQSWNMVSFILQ